MVPPINTKIHWDLGTAYDLFISLRVLHDPDEFGVRASWAAGVRSRIPAEHRELLEKLSTFRLVPLSFIYSLDEPKGSSQLINKLRKLPSESILEKLTLPETAPAEIKNFFLNTKTDQKWSREEILQIMQHWGMEENKETKLLFKNLNEVWTHRKAFGEQLIDALQAYIDNFFAEEELRILPVLQQELSHARMRAGSRPLPAMLEEITAGVRYGDLDQISDIILAPTFWGSPLMFWQRFNDFKLIALFGARPGSMSIIPGDIVPDGLLRGMKALSDSTRLRILRYVAQESQTAAELSRVLRLRPPTVNHHLSQLRMAGMVQVYLDSSGERKYSARYEGFEDTQEMLNSFIRGD